MAIIIPIGVDTSGLRKLNQAGGSLRMFGKVAAVAAGAAGVGALVKTLRIGVEEFRNQQRVSAQTAAVLKSTGGAARVTAQQIEQLSARLERKSMLDDEAIQSGQNLLLTFTKIRNEAGKGNDIFNQTVQAMVDVSTAMGIDANTAAIQLGKALQDPIRGVGQLRRVGVSFTEAQRDQIKTLVESGKTMEAQKMILRELEIQFGGSALAASKTLDGQLTILKNTFNNIAGDLASTFLPAIANAAQKLADFIIKIANAPTFKARAEIVIGGIVDAAGRAFRDLITWWTTTQRTELPARVIITPSGRQQFDAFFTDLERRAREAGARTGQRFANFLIDAFSSEGRRRAGQGIQSVAEQIGKAGQFWLRITGTTLVNSFIEGFFSDFVPTMVKRLRDAFTSAVTSLVPSFTNLGGEIRGAIAKGLGRRGQGSLANVMTSTIREAVQAARGTLTGMAGSLGGMVSDIIGGTSPEAKRAREIRAQQKRELAQREETRLRNAVAQAETDDERKAAEQDLQDFLLEQEAVRLEESVQQQQQAANQSIADLTESFNRGEISAQQFSDALNGLIGANRGAELGKAFAGAFERELQGIINVAKDIASVVGQAQPITAVSGGGVGEALKSENERRFREALDSWEKRRKTRREQAENFRKRPASAGGATITAAEEKEIRDIMAAWDKENPKPQRAQYGLALGGILKQPTFVAGEAGKEAVIPLESGSAMRILRDAIGGGGGSTQIINLTVNAGLGTNPDELSQVIVNSIKRYEKRNGSVFQGPLVSVAANVSGATSTDSGATTFNRIRSLRSG